MSALLDFISFNFTSFWQAQDLDELDSQKLHKSDECLAELEESVSDTEAFVNVPGQSRRSFSSIQVNDGDCSSEHVIGSDEDVAVQDVIHLMNEAVGQMNSNKSARLDSPDQNRPSLRSHNDGSVISRSVSASNTNDGTVIATSRHPDTVQLGGTDIEVGAMDEEESVDLLLARGRVATSSGPSRELYTK